MGNLRNFNYTRKSSKNLLENNEGKFKKIGKYYIKETKIRTTRDIIEEIKNEKKNQPKKMSNSKPNYILF